MKTVCPHDCPDTCAMIALVQNGRLLGVRGHPHHPITRGYLCCKVAHYKERVYSPDRVLYPHKLVGAKEGEQVRTHLVGASTGYYRHAVEGDYRKIRRGSHLALLLCGHHGSGKHVRLQRTAMESARGEPSATHDMLHCCRGGLRLYDGLVGGIDSESLVYAKTIIVWGMNPASTCTHQMAILRNAQKRGATLIVIDPFRTRTAECADRHVHLEHGTDSALALGMMRVIFREGLHDE